MSDYCRTFNGVTIPINILPQSVLDEVGEWNGNGTDLTLFFAMYF